MAGLPTFQHDDQAIMLLQTKWRDQLNPVLSNTLIQGHQLSGVQISSAHINVVNHKLGRLQQGWFIVDTPGPHNISRIQPLNQNTLALISSSDVTIALWVY